jgi:flagellar basal body P-ring formation protein FlgA
MLKIQYGKTIIALFVLISLWAQPALCSQKENLDQDKLNKAVKEYIEKNMPWPAGSIRVEILSRLSDISLPDGKFSWKVDSNRDGGFIGDAYFLLKIYTNGILFREENIRVRIEVLRDVVSSARSLGKDSIITTDDVYIQKKWMRSIALNSLSSIDDVIGKSLSVGVRPNTEIMRNMVKEATAVKKGKMVQVLLDNGIMRITASGISEEDGVEGSLVKVRNLSSNKTIYARVIGDAKVRVDF